MRTHAEDLFSVSYADLASAQRALNAKEVVVPRMGTWFTNSYDTLGGTGRPPTYRTSTEHTRKVVVTGVPAGMPQTDLKKIISAFGTIERVYQVRTQYAVVFTAAGSRDDAIKAAQLLIPGTNTWLNLVDPKLL